MASRAEGQELSDKCCTCSEVGYGSKLLHFGMDSLKYCEVALMGSCHWCAGSIQRGGVPRLPDLAVVSFNFHYMQFRSHFKKSR